MQQDFAKSRTERLDNSIVRPFLHTFHSIYGGIEGNALLGGTVDKIFQNVTPNALPLQQLDHFCTMPTVYMEG